MHPTMGIRMVVTAVLDASSVNAAVSRLRTITMAQLGSVSMTSRLPIHKDNPDT